MDFESWKSIYLRFVSNNLNPEFLKALDQNSGKRFCKLLAKDAVGLTASAIFDVPKAT